MAIFEPCTASVLLTVQTVTVVTGAALLANVMLHPAAAAATLTVYDNTAGSGTVLAFLTAVSGGASVLFPFSPAVYCKTGLTCVVTGTGAQAQIYYQAEL